MTPHEWDPGQYLRFSDERARPFYDLVGRIGATDPSVVLDLGCGPGGLTAGLADRWPDARVLGIDNSPEMIGHARSYERDGHVSFEIGEIGQFQSDEPVDVLISNAALQWVPGHLQLLPRLAAMLAADGWLAFQVPHTLNQPSHTSLRELANDSRFAALLGDVVGSSAHDAATYWQVLAPLGLRVDAWETSYLHIVSGPDEVVKWVLGTGARPYLQALPESLRAEFLAAYSDRLETLYPATPLGTVLAYRRVFVVAHRRSTS